MKPRTEQITAIGAALNAYTYGDSIIIRSALNGISDEGLCTLYGITGVFVHAVTGKPPMPVKWQKQIHEDLLEAFCEFANQAHAERVPV